jgi:hypothetical protein
MVFGIKFKINKQFKLWKRFMINKAQRNNNGIKKEVNVYFLNPWCEVQLIISQLLLLALMIQILSVSQKKEIKT